MAKLRTTRRLNLIRNYFYETHNYDENTKEHYLSDKAKGVTIAEWKEKVLEEIFSGKIIKSAIKSCALIFHDKDRNDDGTLVNIHCHIVLDLVNAVSVETYKKIPLYEKLNDNEYMFQNINVERTISYPSSIQYLTHRDSKSISKKKWPYEIRELYVKVDSWDNDFLEGDELVMWYQDACCKNDRARADVKTIINKIIERASKGEFLSSDEIEEEFYKDLGEYLNPEDIYSYYQANENKIIRALNKGIKSYTTSLMMAEVKDGETQLRDFGLVYIGGNSAAGKSRFALDLGYKLAELENHRGSLYRSSSGPDWISKYNNEVVTLLDDYDYRLIQNSFSNFLMNFDTTSYPTIGSRYNDKYFISKYAIITKSSSISRYFDSIVDTVYSPTHEEKENNRKQVYRRVKLGVFIEHNKVSLQKYDEDTNSFVVFKVFNFNNQKDFFNREVREKILDYIIKILRANGKTFERLTKVSKKVESKPVILDVYDDVEEIFKDKGSSIFKDDEATDLSWVE